MQQPKAHLRAYAHCHDGCGDLEHDGTGPDAFKVADKHTKDTGHATGAGVLNPEAQKRGGKK